MGRLRLHVFEYHASGLNVEQGLAEFLFVGWDVVSGLGWGALRPRTHLGHVASIILSASGIVSVALLTVFPGADKTALPDHIVLKDDP